jgi:hypothetical protein
MELLVFVDGIDAMTSKQMQVRGGGGGGCSCCSITLLIQRRQHLLSFFDGS